jgi:CarD family transcriptional regulator
VQIAVGDYVVYPTQGVGRVSAIEGRVVAGQRLAFAAIQLLDTGLEVLVPVDKLEHVGVRRIIDASFADAVLGVFDEPVPRRRGVSWIRQSREYEARVASGSAGEVAEVLRDMYVLKWGGPLSFGQLRLFERSRRLVVRELAIALDDAPDRVERVIVARIRAANAA